MDISKITKEELSKMSPRELSAYIRAGKPGYVFRGYLSKKEALPLAYILHDELHDLRVQKLLHQTPESRKAISWDEYFMGVARLSAQRSKDPKTQVGAVIVDSKTNHIVSIGYNGFPYGLGDDPAIWNTDEKHFYVVHAEANAILNATTDNLAGDIIYVTEYPCNECAKLLAQKRISKVIYEDDKYKNKEAGNYAAKIFQAAGIEVVQYKSK